MRSQRILISFIATMITLTAMVKASAQNTQSIKPYQQMTISERKSYVGLQARNIARSMSGMEYEFTPEFTDEIQLAVESYVQRIGNNGGDQLWKGDARIVFERGPAVAPMLIRSFRAQNLSPLMGLYIPVVESEYVNIQTPNSVGAIGMFQFLPKTGARFGLNTGDLLNVEKSANAAALYLAGNLKRFKDDKMKEALALLAYNRGERAVENDLVLLVNDNNRACSICALTSQRDRLDRTFQTENVFYVPRFFAAAIIGENPRTFGLQQEPLSSYEIKR